MRKIKLNVAYRNSYIKVVALAFLLCFIPFHSSGQPVTDTLDKKIAVNFSGVMDTGIRSAYLQKATVPKENKVETKFELSFVGFTGLVRNPNGSKKLLVLTASSGKGAIVGRQYWCSSSLPGNNLTSETLSTLNVNAKLQDAQAYSLTLEEDPGGISCKECGELAVTICGAGKVASVTCGGTDDSCSYTCQQPNPDRPMK